MCVKSALEWPTSLMNPPQNWTKNPQWTPTNNTSYKTAWEVLKHTKPQPMIHKEPRSAVFAMSNIGDWRRSEKVEENVSAVTDYKLEDWAVGWVLLNKLKQKHLLKLLVIKNRRYAVLYISMLESLCFVKPGWSYFLITSASFTFLSPQPLLHKEIPTQVKIQRTKLTQR